MKADKITIAENEEIVSFEQVNALYKEGVNLCIGCRYERNASCTDDRFYECDNQYSKLKSNNMKVYALFQTDVWKSNSSRVFCGLFSSEIKAIDAAKKEGLYTSESEVVILECEIDKFEE